jgi:hypothetical protein
MVIIRQIIVFFILFIVIRVIVFHGKIVLITFKFPGIILFRKILFKKNFPGMIFLRKVRVFAGRCVVSVRIRLHAKELLRGHIPGGSRSFFHIQFGIAVFLHLGSVRLDPFVFHNSHAGKSRLQIL